MRMAAGLRSSRCVATGRPDDEAQQRSAYGRPSARQCPRRVRSGLSSYRVQRSGISRFRKFRPVARTLILVRRLASFPSEGGVKMERRLAAILATDVVGYSSQMEVAEERTAEDLAQCQSMIARTADRLGGRVFNTAGDSAVAEFSSPVSAVRCGVEIQRYGDARGGSSDGTSRLPLRVGVHLADVIVSGDDLIGDGVNVAARIQEAAEPSSVFVSHSIFEQMRTL